ncbi:MAG: hypothetical protein AB9M60_04145, partial [Leptothrix sp. (in: b-proteobacteria)]
LRMQMVNEFAQAALLAAGDLSERWNANAARQGGAPRGDARGEWRGEPRGGGASGHGAFDPRDEPPHGEGNDTGYGGYGGSGGSGGSGGPREGGWQGQRDGKWQGRRDGAGSGVDRNGKPWRKKRWGESDEPRPAGPRPTARLPEDRAAGLLMQRHDWWPGLTGIDHDLLCELPGWHGELFRHLDQLHMDSEPLPWPALRDTLVAFEWGSAAARMVDSAEEGIEPLQEDLLHVLQQIRKAQTANPALRQLGRM